jgi:hypothetical protein
MASKSLCPYYILFSLIFLALVYFFLTKITIMNFLLYSNNSYAHTIKPNILVSGFIRMEQVIEMWQKHWKKTSASAIWSQFIWSQFIWSQCIGKSIERKTFDLSLYDIQLLSWIMCHWIFNKSKTVNSCADQNKITSTWSETCS